MRYLPTQHFLKVQRLIEIQYSNLEPSTTLANLEYSVTSNDCQQSTFPLELFDKFPLPPILAVEQSSHTQSPLGNSSVLQSDNVMQSTGGIEQQRCMRMSSKQPCRPRSIHPVNCTLGVSHCCSLSYRTQTERFTRVRRNRKLAPYDERRFSKSSRRNGTRAWDSQETKWQGRLFALPIRKMQGKCKVRHKDIELMNQCVKGEQGICLHCEKKSNSWCLVQGKLGDLIKVDNGNTHLFLPFSDLDRTDREQMTGCVNIGVLCSSRVFSHSWVSIA